MDGYIDVTRFTLPAGDAQRLTDAICYGTIHVAQALYPIYAHVYDEDMGQYTDYGMNDSVASTANVSFRGLLSIAVVDVEWDGSENAPAHVTMLTVSIPAVVAFLLDLKQDALQTEVWTHRAEDGWESDGHYGLQSREEYVSEAVKSWWLGGVWIERITHLLLGYRTEDLMAKLVVGRNPIDIRRQLACDRGKNGKSA